ncbi:MAG: Flp pilus assembly protein CpaB, partial [Nitrospinota bacterium]
MTRTRGLILILVALLMGGVGVLVVRRGLVPAPPPGPPPIPTAEVLIMTKDISLGDRLAEGDVKTVKWPEKSVPERALREPQEAIGRVVVQPLAKGEPILPNKLAPKGEGQGLMAVIPPGKRAMSVKVDEVVGVAGFVQPNSRVDVLVSMDVEEEGARGGRKEVSRIILQNIRVLAIGQRTELKDNKPVTVTVVTMEVGPAEAEALNLAATRGKIILAMRSLRDPTRVITAGLTTGELVSGQWEEKGPPPEVKPPGVPLASAVVMRRDVAAGQKISPDDVEQVEWPRANLPKGALRGVEEAVERLAVQPLVKGELLFPRKLKLAPAIPIERVVVMRRAVPEGQKIAEADVEVVEWPKASIPEGALREPDEAVGQVATQPLVERELLLPRKLKAASAVPMAKVVLVRRAVPEGRKLVEADLEVAEWPKASIPKGAIRKTEKALGQVATHPLVKGEVLFPQKLKTAPAVPMDNVVVVRRTVPEGRKLAEADLKVAEWPKASIPRGALRKQEMAVGKLAAQSLVKGELLFPQKLKPAPAVPMEKVLVARKNVAEGVRLSRADLEVAEWPKASVPPGALRKVEEAIGQVAIQPLVKGEPLFPKKLSLETRPKAKGQSLVTLIPPGKRAMSIKVDEVIGVSGFVLPESRVDVLVTWEGAGRREESRIILQNIRVLAVGQQIEVREEKPVRVSVVTLEVTPEEAERLTLASTQGKVLLALRGLRDGTTVTSRGVSKRTLIRGRRARRTVAQRRRRPATARKPAAPPAPPPAPPPLTIEVELIRGIERTRAVYRPGRGEEATAT